MCVCVCVCIPRVWRLLGGAECAYFSSLEADREVAMCIFLESGGSTGLAGAAVALHSWSGALEEGGSEGAHWVSKDAEELHRSGIGAV